VPFKTEMVVEVGVIFTHTVVSSYPSTKLYTVINFDF